MNICVIYKIHVFFGQKNLITIHDLFNWSVEKGWNMFWDQGKKHYREEMIFYELLSQRDSDPHCDAGSSTSATQDAVRSSIAPIDVDATE